MKFDPRGAARAHAMHVLGDPTSEAEDRLAARSSLTRSSPDLAGLSPADRRLLGVLLRKAHGEDERGERLPNDPSSRRGRAQDEALDAMRAAERAIAECDRVWRETGGPASASGWRPPRPSWMTVTDLFAALVELDPRGEEIRRLVARDDEDERTPAPAEQDETGEHDGAGDIPDLFAPDSATAAPLPFRGPAIL